MFSLPCCLDGADKELRTIGVFSSICHWQDTCSGVLQGEVLIFKFIAIDWFATSSITTCEVTTLKYLVKFLHLHSKALMTRNISENQIIFPEHPLRGRLYESFQPGLEFQPGKPGWKLSPLSIHLLVKLSLRLHGKVSARAEKQAWARILALLELGGLGIPARVNGLRFVI